MARIWRLLLLVAAAAAMEQYNVEVDVTLSSGKTGKFVVEVHPDWAPLGAQRFKEIIHAEIWTGARFFRVVRGFVSGGQSSLRRAPASRAAHARGQSKPAAAAAAAAPRRSTQPVNSLTMAQPVRGLRAPAGSSRRTGACPGGKAQQLRPLCPPWARAASPRPAQRARWRGLLQQHP